MARGMNGKPHARVVGGPKSGAPAAASSEPASSKEEPDEEPEEVEEPEEELPLEEEGADGGASDGPIVFPQARRASAGTTSRRRMRGV
jgi:hypothetical protein